MFDKIVTDKLILSVKYKDLKVKCEYLENINIWINMIADHPPYALISRESLN